MDVVLGGCPAWEYSNYIFKLLVGWFNLPREHAQDYVDSRQDNQRRFP